MKPKTDFEGRAAVDSKWKAVVVVVGGTLPADVFPALQLQPPPLLPLPRASLCGGSRAWWAWLQSW